MYSLSANKRRWRIEKDNKTILYGIGTASQATALAKSLGIVLNHFCDLPKFERIA